MKTLLALTIAFAITAPAQDKEVTLIAQDKDAPLLARARVARHRALPRGKGARARMIPAFEKKTGYKVKATSSARA